MAYVLAKSLAVCRGLDIDHLSELYLRWWREDGFDAGPVFNEVMSLLDQGENRQEAPKRVDRIFHGLTAGCNPAHRIAPLGLIPDIPIKALPELAIKEAQITHLHPLAADVSAAVVVLIRTLVDGLEYEEAKEMAANGRLKETREALLSPDSRPIMKCGYSPEVLRAAMHFVNQNSDMEKALAESILFAGNSNYCPVLVGVICGSLVVRKQEKIGLMDVGVY